MELKDVLKQERNKKGFSLRGLAKSSNMSQAYLSQLENGSSTRPAKEKLLAISYALDPQGYDKVFSKLISTTNIEIQDPEKEFKDYASTKIFDIDLTKLTNKMRINKKDKSAIELDVPSFDIEWLLNQDIFEVYLGVTDDFVTNSQGKYKEEILVLSDEEKILLKDSIDEVKQSIIKERNRPFEELDKKELEINSFKYDLLKDLLNGRIKSLETLSEKIYLIKQNKDLINKTYFDEIFEAVKQNDGLRLQKLIDINTIEELNNMR